MELQQSGDEGNADQEPLSDLADGPFAALNRIDDPSVGDLGNRVSSVTSSPRSPFKWRTIQLTGALTRLASAEMFRKPSRIIFNRLIEFRVPEHRLPGCHPDGISEPGRDGTNPKDRGMQNILGFGPFGTLRASDDGGRPFPARCRRVIIRTDWIDPSASEERAVTMTWRDALLRILMPATICLLPMFGPTVRADDHARADHPEDARLDALFREYLDAWFADEPLTATRLGDHRFDDRLDDLSPEARDAWVERDRRVPPRTARAGRLRCALPRRSDRLRRSSAPPRQRHLAGRELPALRGGPPGLRRLHDRGRLSAVHPVDPAVQGEPGERHRAHRRRSRGSSRRRRRRSREAPQG